MSERPVHRRFPWVNVCCALAVVLLVVLSWSLAPRPKGEGEEAFGGTDAAVSSMLEKDGVERWFEPLFEPGSGEVESGLFAAQAALGGVLFGYAVGRLQGRRRDVPSDSMASAGS
ncbi:cobalt/nickel transport protein [Austwickia chelonae]|uniref:Cobalt transport protein CbiN n=1 Tax=Austwickia chelonae NBRC 105200 TaxID=1184607 RepID=K6W5I2_9MICO|nr:energy-coupling factor ABC transporter substrate-binding protein [Austwickia chelonae]GAB77077.1 putative ABC transporter protein [Austwickia chelonae NBRC 105200]SEW33827.1 cobalt/nickel transport protein [Austwickia chelonae]